MNATAPHSSRNDLLLVLVTFLAGAGWLFSKEALAGMPPLHFLGIRFTLAGLILALIGLPLLRRLQAWQWKRAIAMGSLFSVALMIWILGLQHTKYVGEGAFITSMGVVMVPVVARFVFREQLPLSTWLAIPIAMTGLALLSLNRGVRLETGQILFLAAATLFSFHFNFNARVTLQIPALALTAIQLTMVGLLSLVAARLTEHWPTTIPAASWSWLLASALLASCARFLLQNYAQSRASASHAAVIMILEPVWASLLAGIWLHETMRPLQLAGCALIFLALLVNRWRAIRNLIRSR